MSKELPVKKVTRKMNARYVQPPEKGPNEHRDHPDNYWTLRNRLIWFSIVFSLVSICFSAASVLLAIVALNRGLENQRLSIANQRDLKGIDLLVSFQKRYDELAYDERPKVKDERTATAYYHRFWDLQFEQYQYWNLGLIKPEIYASWMDFRRQEFDRNDEIGKIKFQDGWKEAKKDYLYTGDPKRLGYYKEFTDFMDDVFQGNSSRYSSGPPKR